MPATPANFVLGGAKIVVGTDLGALVDGTSIIPTVEILTFDIEQELSVSRAWRISEKITIDFTLAEPTLENVKIAWDILQAIVPGPPRTLSISPGQLLPQERVVAMSSFEPGVASDARTVTFHKAIVETMGPLKFTKRELATLKVGMFCMYDYTTNNRVGQFSDA